MEEVEEDEEEVEGEEEEQAAPVARSLFGSVANTDGIAGGTKKKLENTVFCGHGC